MSDHETAKIKHDLAEIEAALTALAHAVARHKVSLYQILAQANQYEAVKARLDKLEAIVAERRVVLRRPVILGKKP